MNSLPDLLATGRFLVLVSPPRNHVELVAAAFEAGADAAKVHLNVDHRASGTRFGTWTEERAAVAAMVEAAQGPVGVMPGAEVLPSAGEMHEMAGAGLSFFDVYASHMQPWMWDLPMTRMVALGHPFDPQDAAALEARGMDVLEASVVAPAGYGSALTQEDLEAYRSLAHATHRPVVVPSQRALVPDDLARLRAVGVAGVLLGTLSLGDTAEAFSARLPAFVAAAAAV